MNIQGTIHVIYETKQVSDKFRKREFVVKHADNPMYPQYSLFQFKQDNCEFLNNYNPGQFVSVDFNLNGREWTSPQGEVKYFNSLDAWRIAAVQGEPVLAEVQDFPERTEHNYDDDDDDLPF